MISVKEGTTKPMQTPVPDSARARHSRWVAVARAMDTRHAILTPLLHFRTPLKTKLHIFLPSCRPSQPDTDAALIHVCHSSAPNSISGIFISAQEWIYSFTAQIAQLFQACLHDFQETPFFIWADCICSGGGTRLLEIGDKTSVHTKISTSLPQRAYGR